MLSYLSRFFTFFSIDYREYIPKSFICLREGYTRSHFFNDLFAGIGIGIISLPLNMAFAIASGVSPERGLFTGIIAGFLVSFLGGSRVQITGPTGAYVILVYSVVEKHGYEGLAIATLLSGLMILAMGLARLGSWLKYIPYPVITGFTAGIALTIFSSQIKDFLGLQVDKIPVDFIGKWSTYLQNFSTWNPWAFSIALFTLIMIGLLRRYFPKAPGAVIAVVCSSILVAFFELPVSTIATKFGSIPNMLPVPSLPSMSLEKVLQVFPDAIPIALLGAIESLLSAVVADGTTGTRHRSNCELFAQGIGNLGSACFGGIPATGAIARTSANIKMNAKTPFAGMIHAITLLLLMVLFAPFAVMIPMPTLAAVLIFVAWNMSEIKHFGEIFRGPRSEVFVLVSTFLLTVLVDLSVAVQLGVVFAALLFLKRMTDSTQIKNGHLLFNQKSELPERQDSKILFRDDVPSGVLVFEIDGPFFFGVSDLLNEAFVNVDSTTKVFILRMGKIPMIDSTGIRSLKMFHKRCQDSGILFMLSGVRPHLFTLFRKAGVDAIIGKEHIFSHIADALRYSKKYIGLEEEDKINELLLSAD